MRVNRTQSNVPSNANPGFKGIRIVAKENKEVKYLYNKVLDMVREERLSGEFATDYIKLNTEKPKIVQQLLDYGIKFIKGE